MDRWRATIMSVIQFAARLLCTLLFSFQCCCCGQGVANIDAGNNTYLYKFIPAYGIFVYIGIEPSSPFLVVAGRTIHCHRFEQRNCQTCPYDSKCCHDYLLIQNRQHRGLCWIRGQSVEIHAPLVLGCAFTQHRIDGLSTRNLPQSIFNYL